MVWGDKIEISEPKRVRDLRKRTKEPLWNPARKKEDKSRENGGVYSCCIYWT